MVAPALGQRQQVVVLIAEGGGARQQGHLGQCGQRLQGLRQPGCCRLPGHGRVAGQQPAAHLVLLVAQDHPRARAAGGQCRRQAGRAGAHDQHVAVRMALVIAVGVGHGGRCAQAAGSADVALEEVPGGLRGHEGLVIEAGRDQACEPAVDGTQVEVDARAGVDGARAQAVHQFDLGHARIGHRAGAVPQLRQRIRFFDPGRQDAARPVVLPAARHQAHAVGQQRRSQRVAVQPLVAAAVEVEGQRPAAVDAAASLQAVRQAVGHGTGPSVSGCGCGCGCGCGSPTFQVAAKR